MLKPQPRYLYHHQYHQTPELTTHPSTSPYAHVPHILINPPPPLPTPPPYPEKAYHPHPLPPSPAGQFRAEESRGPLPPIPPLPARIVPYAACETSSFYVWVWELHGTGFAYLVVGGGIWYLDAIAIYTHIYIFATPCPRPCSWGVYSVPACAR